MDSFYDHAFGFMVFVVSMTIPLIVTIVALRVMKWFATPLFTPKSSRRRRS